MTSNEMIMKALINILNHTTALVLSNLL